SGMSAVRLFVPAERRFDRSVRHAVSVADDKVIADTPPRDAVRIELLTMSRVDLLDVAETGGGMVNDDVFPGARLGLDRPFLQGVDGAGHDGVGSRSNRSGG